MKTDQLVDDYLVRLKEALTTTEPQHAAEIYEQIAAHITTRLEEVESPTQIDTLRILDELGSPQEIAGVAEDRPRRAKLRGWHEAVALLLTELLTPLLTPLVWPVGVFLVWKSSLWRAREKWLATLVIPGGLYTAMVLNFQGRSCAYWRGSGSPPAGFQPSCSPGDFVFGLLQVIHTILEVLPVVVTIFLAFVAWRRLSSSYEGLVRSSADGTRPSTM
jgi:hypothetical protein